MGKIKQATLDRVAKSWLEASRKLGIRVIAPYTLTVEGDSTQCLAFLPDFGGPNGTVVGALMSPKLTTDVRLVSLAKKAGLFCSSVNPVGWEEFDEATFKDALEDWGYYGSREKRPAWFAGYEHLSD